MSKQQSYEELVRELVKLWVNYAQEKTVYPTGDDQYEAREKFYDCLNKAVKRVVG